MFLVGLIVPTALGFVITLLISPQIKFWERLALSYGLGFAFLTLAMFFLNVVGIKFSLLNTLVLVSGIFFVLLGYLMKKNWTARFLLRKIHLFQRIKKVVSSLSIFEKIIVSLLCFFIFSNIVIGVYWPVYWSDALTVYDFRAKLLAQTLFFPRAAALNIEYPEAVFSYPPMTSLVHTWLYLWGWANPKIFYSLLLVCLATIFYYSLRDHSPRYHCLIFTLILITVPHLYTHATCAYTNFPFAFYFSVATLYLYRWMTEEKGGFLVLAGIFMGLSSWVRYESEIFFLGYLAILTVFSLSRKRYFAPFLFALLYFSIEPLWKIYFQHVLGLGISHATTSRISDTLSASGKLLDFRQWKKVMVFLWKWVGYFHVTLALFILTSLLYIDRVRKHRFLVLVIASNLILFVVATYIYSLTRTHWNNAGTGGAVRRLFIMFLPIIWYFIAVMTAESGYLKDEASR